MIEPSTRFHHIFLRVAAGSAPCKFLFTIRNFSLLLGISLYYLKFLFTMGNFCSIVNFFSRFWNVYFHWKIIFSVETYPFYLEFLLTIENSSLLS